MRLLRLSLIAVSVGCGRFCVLLLVEGLFGLETVGWVMN